MARRSSRPEHKAKEHKKHEHKKHDGHKHHHHKGGGGDGSGGQPVSEDLKESSTQSSQDAMDAVPGGHPADYPNEQAVFTTGPGNAVEYNYQRLGTYADEYALQQQEYQAPVPPISGFGQVLTTSSASGTGAENNPT